MFFVIDIQAQNHCGTVQYTKMMQNKNIINETTEGFEQWMKTKLSKKGKRKREEAEVINIPVVVHIIHNGEPVGFGLNIPDEQIFSQIEVLNEDFRRLNDDRVNTPTTFEPIAADIEMTFELASRDPEGLATNGIVRVDGGRPLWELADNYLLKSKSYWPAEDYLNIWVTDLGSGFLGFAQFPVSPLEGLEDASNSRLTDGAVVDYRSFGSQLKFPAADLNPKYDRGRTASHEVGHYFGLRHIWGDGNCNVDDFCNDTPLQSSDNNGLANCSFPGKNTCSSETPDLPDMFQNFMDYTNDVCMNLFTEDQKSRMRTVLDNSPRRISLKSSLGNTPPVIVANDLGIRTILSPTYSVCGDAFSPSIEVRNYGSNIITNYILTVKINGVLSETYTSAMTINPLEINTIDLQEVSIPDTNEMLLSIEVISVNNTDDNNDSNDLMESIIVIPKESIGLPNVNFNQIPSDWILTNPDDLTTWETTGAPNGSLNNQALFLNFYDYENEGSIDLYSSPSFSIENETSAKLSFDLSYAKYPGVDLEALIIVIGQQCENPLTDADTIYHKEADELATAGVTSLDFLPSSSADWRVEEIDLAPYLGQDALQITFIGKNAFGNNLYIDNIEIKNVQNRIISPSVVTCISDQSLIVEVVNEGVDDISSFELTYQLDNLPTKVLTINLEEPLEPGFSTELIDDLGILDDGFHELAVVVNLPDATQIQLNQQFYIDKTVDIIPIRENMNNLDNSPWIIVNNDNDLTWKQERNESKTVLKIDNLNYTNLNEKDWFVSPSLNFSETDFATLTFEVAQSSNQNPGDGLSVLISTDCGENYNNVEYAKFGNNLSTGNFDGEPSLSDWRLETVDLSAYVGLSQVRIAFVSTNRNGNSLFLDDIQVYASQFIQETTDILFPNPSFDGRFNLRFDLTQKEDITVIIYSSNGDQLNFERLSGTLNQLYTFDINNEPAGMYFIRIVGDSFTTTRRLVKSN